MSNSRHISRGVGLAKSDLMVYYLLYRSLKDLTVFYSGGVKHENKKSIDNIQNTS